MSGHTQGPWSVIAADAGELVITADSGGADPEDVAVVSTHPRCHPNGHANAQLISAAPDMLAALEGLAAAVGDRLLAGGPLSKEYAHAVMAEIKAAILKATNP